LLGEKADPLGRGSAGASGVERLDRTRILQPDPKSRAGMVNGRAIG